MKKFLLTSLLLIASIEPLAKPVNPYHPFSFNGFVMSAVQ
jgi:hypothetical protein